MRELARDGLLPDPSANSALRVGSSTATTACRSARRAYSRRPSSTAAAASGDAEGSSTSPTRSAAVHAMPAPADGHPVHHVRGPQLDVVLRQRLCEDVAQLAVFLVAPRAVRAVLVDDHRDHGLGLRRGDHLHQVTHPVDELLAEVDPHHRPEFTTPTDTSTNEFSGTKPRTAGNAAINAPGRFSSKSALAVMNVNADGHHRQPALMRTGATVLLCRKSALWVALFYCLSHGVDA